LPDSVKTADCRIPQAPPLPSALPLHLSRHYCCHQHFRCSKRHYRCQAPPLPVAPRGTIVARHLRCCHQHSRCFDPKALTLPGTSAAIFTPPRSRLSRPNQARCQPKGPPPARDHQRRKKLISAPQQTKPGLSPPITTTSATNRRTPQRIGKTPFQCY